MFETHGSAFFAALRSAVERQFGRDHPCFSAADHAAAAPSADVAATLAVQEALAALNPLSAAQLMAEVHRIMREAPIPILGNWGETGPAH